MPRRSEARIWPSEARARAAWHRSIVSSHLSPLGAEWRISKPNRPSKDGEASVQLPEEQSDAEQWRGSRSTLAAQALRNLQAHIVQELDIGAFVLQSLVVGLERVRGLTHNPEHCCQALWE